MKQKLLLIRKNFLILLTELIFLSREGDKKPIIINITDGSLEVNVNSCNRETLTKIIDIKKEGKDTYDWF